MTILFKVTPPHSFYLLTHQPVNLFHDTKPYFEIILFICLLVYDIFLLNIKLLRAGAGFILLYQWASTRYSKILNE